MARDPLLLLGCAALLLAATPAGAQFGWAAAFATPTTLTGSSEAEPTSSGLASLWTAALFDPPQILTLCVEGPPRIEAIRVEAPQLPAPGVEEVISRGSTHYVDGGALDVLLTVSGDCNGVSDVRADGRSLPRDAGDGIDSVGSWWEFVGSTPLGQGMREVRIRIYFSNLGLGSTSALRLIVTHQEQRGADAADLLLVRVAEVGAPDDQAGLPHASLPVTREQLHNNLVEAVYGIFGDFGRVDLDDTSIDLVDPSYDDCTSASWDPCLGVEIGASSISFRAWAKAELSFCSPDVSLTGSFQLEANESGIGLVWLDGPEAEVDFPAWCLGPISDAALGWLVEDSVGDQAEAEIDAQLRGRLPSCGAGCGLAIAGFRYAPEFVEVLIRTPLPHVRIRVPYRHTNLEEPWTYGMHLSAFDDAILIPGGIAEACTADRQESASTCPRLPVTAEGIANLEGDDPAIPWPWQGQAYYAERQKVRDHMQAVFRFPELLPRPDLKPAALLLRASSGANNDDRALQAVDRPCRVITSVVDMRYALGPNDRPHPSGSEYGSLDYEATFMWPEGLDITDLPECEAPNPLVLPSLPSGSGELLGW